MKKKLFLSFSGGRTSGYMTKQVKDTYSDSFEIIVLFANTGYEDHKTLDFVHHCDQNFGFDTVWLEAVINPAHRKGTTHKVVTYETASRNCEPFAAMISKYGIPNKSYPHCTRELKRRPMESYLKSIGWKDHETAIGIRMDEARRVSKEAEVNRIIYPLLNWFPVDKTDVLMWWNDQEFDLDIEEHCGNCLGCWKKSDKKLVRLVHERPEIFDFTHEMETKFTHAGAGEGPRVFFREKKSTEDLRKLAEFLEPWIAPKLSDEDDGCTESCEVYPTEQASFSFLYDVS